MLIDTHAHIYSDNFSDDLNETITRAKEAGIERIYMPNIDSGSVESMMAVEREFPDYCFSMMGLHPCSVNESYREELKIVEDWLTSRPFKAVGEIGTDLYWDKTYQKEQEFAFNYQVDLALEHRLPIVIHCRESIDLTIDLVSKKQNGTLRGIFHCFTGNFAQAKKIIDLGFLLGIGGVITFKNSGLDQIIENVDLNHLVLETDSPYLAPTPNRGKRNEPSFIVQVAKKLADVYNVNASDIANITGKNALKLFE